MPEKVGLWKKIEKNKKLQVVFFCVSMVALASVYIPYSVYASRKAMEKIAQNVEISEDYNVLTCIENISVEKEKLFVSGWAMRIGSYNTKLSLILKETNSEEEVAFLADLYERKEIAEYFDPNWDFGAVAFEVNDKFENMKEDGCYEIMAVLSYEVEKVNSKGEIVTEENQKKVSTNKFLYKGELYSYNPLEYKKPIITDGELVKVIDEGILRNYDLDKKIWVYQYENKLFCILNTTEDFIKESGMGVLFSPRTSRRELLPSNRQERGYSIFGYYYEKDEYKRDGVLPYQVVVINLTQKYPITYAGISFYDVEKEEYLYGVTVELEDWIQKKNEEE